MYLKNGGVSCLLPHELFSHFVLCLHGYGSIFVAKEKPQGLVLFSNNPLILVANFDPYPHPARLLLLVQRPNLPHPQFDGVTGHANARNSGQSWRPGIKT